MKLAKNSIISEQTIKGYLLIKRKRNDKSKWLAQAGYSISNWKRLRDDLRNQILPMDAELIDDGEFGKLFMIKGILSGPLDKKLEVCSVWMIEKETGKTKFITVYPDKRRK